MWNFAPNLVHVKPYHFFKHTGDINAPPGLSKHDQDGGKHKTGEKFTFTPKAKKESPSFKGKIDKLKDKKDAESESSSSESDEKKEQDDTGDASAEKRSVKEPERESEKEAEKESEKEKEKSPEQRVSDDLDLSDSEASSSMPATTNGQKEVSSSDKDAKRDDDDSKVDPEDPDDYLMFLEDILKTLHKAFYDLYDQYKSDSKVPAPDLKTVIPYVKRKVLSGVVIVFSGVIPTQVQLSS